MENMDDPLRNRLWNALDTCYWSRMRGIGGETGEKNLNFLRNIWCNVLKKSIQDIRIYRTVLDVNDLIDVKIYPVYRELEWYKVYDLIQFIATEYPNDNINAEFIEESNRILDEEKSYYHFIGEYVVPRASDEEIAQIEKALQSSFEPVRKHMDNALKELSNRQSPVFANSMKESITAVEAVLQAIEKNDLVLSKNVEVIAKKIHMHPSLQSAIKSLYSYANDTEIRHTAKQDTNLDMDDALFFVVNCASWVNYFEAKVQKYRLIKQVNPS